MKKIHKGKQQLLFALLSVFVLLSVCLLQSCQPDGKMVKSGTFGLRLSADTTSLNKGVNSDLKTKGYEDEFEEFLETSDYSILIVKDQKDTVQTFPRYDEMPAEIELAEGAYTLIASKGDNKGAAFENPYFEGSTDFTIRGDMNTYIDVMCTLGNTRVVTESSKEFDDVYEDYTIVIKTPYTSEDGFEIEKGETSPAFFRADKEGTEAEVVVKLKKKGSTEEESFSSIAPLILERRQNVNIMLKLLEGNQGIGLEVTLDDSMVEVPMEVYIPDYMWGEHDKPLLTPVDFENGAKFSYTNDGSSSEGLFTTNVKVDFTMEGGVSSLIIKRWLGEDLNSAVYYDLATEEGMNSALERKLTWTADGETDILLSSKTKSGTIDFKNAINTLVPPSEDEGEFVYYYEVYGKDATGKEYETNIVNFSVTVYPVGKPAIIMNNNFPETNITEGDVMSAERVVYYKAPEKLRNATLKIQIGQGNIEEYNVLENSSELESKWNIISVKENDKVAKITFPKEFSSLLTAQDNGGVNTYSYTFSLEDEKGNKDELTREIIVNAPVFTLDISDGNAFAKRVYLRGQLTQGSSDKLTFLQNGQKITPEIIMLDATTYEAVVTGLIPETQYTFQTVYNNKDNRKSEEKMVTTEEENTFVPNAGFEEWTIETDANGSNAEGANNLVSGVGGVFDPDIQYPYRYWEVWQPWSEKKAWNTVNKVTTSDGGFYDKITNTDRQWTSYVANSGTIPVDGYNSVKAALVRTVGWGLGNTATIDGGLGTVHNITPGELFLGDYSNDNPVYGIDFKSRPYAFSFDYKYECKSNDAFIAELVVLDKGGNIIAKTQLNSDEAKPTTSWTNKKVVIDYSGNNGMTSATKMYIRFVSGISTSTDDLMIYPSASNLSNGEYIGSQLYIDNVQLIYE